MKPFGQTVACIVDTGMPAGPACAGGFGVPGTTISKGKGVVGEWEYVITPGASAADDGEGAQDAAAATTSGSPFKPSSAMAYKRMSKIPYEHDPEGPKLKCVGGARVAQSTYPLTCVL
jgi:hypothetical protein